MRAIRSIASVRVILVYILAFNPFLIHSALAGDDEVRVRPVSGVTIVSPATALPNPAQPGDTVSFLAGAQTDAGKTLTYEWDFGDGSSSSGATTTHLYAAAGNYQAKVRISDGDSSAASSVTVQVGTQAAGRAGATLLAEPLATSTKTKTLTVAPFLSINIKIGNLNPNATTTIHFTGKNFDTTIPALNIDATSVTVLVPPFITNGKLGQGAVTMQCLQGSGTTATISNKILGLKIGALPKPGKVPGTAMLQLLTAQVSAIQQYQAAAAAKGILTAAVETALTNQAATLNALAAKLSAVVQNPKLPYPFDTSGKKNPNALKIMDSLALGLMQGALAYGAGTISPLALKQSTGRGLAEDIGAQFQSQISGLFGAGSTTAGRLAPLFAIAGGIGLVAAVGLGSAAAAGTVALAFPAAIFGLGLLSLAAVLAGIQYRLNNPDASLNLTIQQTASQFLADAAAKAQAVLDNVTQQISSAVTTNVFNDTTVIANDGATAAPFTVVYSGSFTGTGTTTRVFSTATCTWTPTYSGTITLTLMQHSNGTVSGTAHVSGQTVFPAGSSTSSTFTCNAETDPFDDTQAVSGTTSSLTFTTSLVVASETVTMSVSSVTGTGTMAISTLSGSALTATGSDTVSLLKQ